MFKIIAGIVIAIVIFTTGEDIVNNEEDYNPFQGYFLGWIDSIILFLYFILTYFFS